MILGINIALSNRPLSTCKAFDVTRDGVVTVDELVSGVKRAVEGCVPVMNVWQPATVPFDPACSSGCQDELVGTNLAHGAGDLHFQWNPAVDDAIAQWGDCLASMLRCFREQHDVRGCAAAANCPAECKALFAQRVPVDGDQRTLLRVLDGVYVDDAAPCRYGAHDVALAPDTFPAVLDDPHCWDVWATNEAIIAGWVEHPALIGIEKQARAEAVIVSGAIGPVRADAYGLIGVSWRVASAQLVADPNDVTLAHGDIGSVSDAQTGDVYAFAPNGAPAVAEYSEPLQFGSLPDQNSLYDSTQGLIPGMDKHTIYGFFNRAHTDEWCDGISDTLYGLRGLHGAVVEDGCTYLADRVYKGTDPTYLGQRREMRHVGDTALEPICGLYGVQTSGVDPDLPYYLHPG